MKTWRLLKLQVYDAFTNMAIDEAVVKARIEGLVPNTLRFYRWKPSTVSIGRFQNVFNEVQVENCNRQSVDIVRRITGGGAVYHDQNDEITYSVIASEQDFEMPDVFQMYNSVCNGLIEAAKILNIKADFNPGDLKNCPNLAINGKKISGSAQFHKSGVLLQHGTFLIDADLQKMFTFLRVPWAATINDVVCIARDRITSLKKELNRNVNVEEVYPALVRGFGKALEVELEEKSLTAYEEQLALQLRKDKFQKTSWNLEGKA
jgi:lipoyltransferase/lipoate-protein ligase